jgi:hypothetical protein
MSPGRTPEETRRLARLAGATYVALGTSTLFGYFHLPMVLTDVNAIARTIAVSDVRFRVGVMCDILTTVLSIPLVLLLYELFKPVHKSMARLMALFFLVAMPISFVSAFDYVSAHSLFTDASAAPGLDEPGRNALGMFFLHRHTHAVLAEEIFWGLWLFPLGVLVRRSKFIPRWIGLALFIAGIGYMGHSLACMMMGGTRIILLERLAMLMRAGELPIMLWLLIRGANVRAMGPAAASS